ncbi:MAG TPA: BTAD domain-containing putative transcriptional regulator [Ktedonobacteraceae bacterium]|nr:BTAD domain-containing putative transcriptional regulator [Ktedonobacteraceae bacterium]
MAEKLQIYLLGEFRLYRDGTLITHKDWHTRQARQLFKLLLTERGRTVSMRKLTALLWSDYADSAYKTLRSAVSTLRSVLEPERAPQAPSRFVPRGHAGYTLIFPVGSAVWLDVVEFECLLDQALAAPEVHNQERRKLLERALQLYSGDYLAQDEEASWARAERVRLRERYFAGVAALAEWQYEAGLYRDAIELCRQALEFDSCREPLYRLMMQCQAQMGDSVSALQTFEQCRQLLDEYLGADPSPQTLHLHTAILRGEFQTRAPRPLHHLPPYRSPVRIASPFVGRKTELDRLMHQLDEMQTQPAQHARTIAFVGEAGIGKSFLLRLFLHHASSENVYVMTASCQAIEQQVAFAPLVAMLSAWLLEASEEQLQTLPILALSPVATLVPELVRRLPGIVPLSPVAPEQAYSMLIGGLVDLLVALSRLRPLVLAWDDLQWADESTLLVINRLACLEQIALLQVLAYRPEDLSENRPLDSMLHYLRRNEHVQMLPLPPFSPEEVEEYLALHNIAPPLSPERLYRATQGNALFLVEAVRTLLEQKSETPQIQQADPGSFLLHSQQIRDIVLARVERLPACAIELLKIAAAVAHPFTLDLLRPQLSPDDYDALNILLVRRFLVEVNSEQEYRDYEVRLAFSHEMVGQIVYATCTAPQLAQLHGQVAANMVRRYAANTEMHAAEIAFHYRRSGPGAESQVLRYEVEAGDYARHTFSYRQALVHYDTALQLLPRLQCQQSESSIDIAEWAARAYHGRGLVCEALLDWEGVQESQRNLSEWAATNKNIAFASNSTRRMAGIRGLMGYLPEAATIGISVVQHLQADAETSYDIQNHTQKSLRTMLDMTRRWASLVTVDAPHLQHEQASWDEMAASPFPPFYPASSPTIQDWQEIVEALGVSQAALTLAEYGWVLLLQGLNIEAERCLKAALHAAEETDQVTYWILAAMHLSRVYHLYGQPEEGSFWFGRCLERSRQLSAEATWPMTWPLLNYAYYLISLNRLDEAEQVLKQLQAQLDQQRDFLAHRYSIQIGFGLIALSRSDFAQAEALLQGALNHQPNLYIEAYILAEQGIVRIARHQKRYHEAFRRLRAMLAFCGQRSLLQSYSYTVFTLARLALHTGQIQGIPNLLEQLSQLVDAAGYTDIHRQCCALLARVTAASR